MTVSLVCIVVVTGIVTVLVTVSVAVVIACATLAGSGPVIARTQATTKRTLKINLR